MRETTGAKLDSLFVYSHKPLVAFLGASILTELIHTFGCLATESYALAKYHLYLTHNNRIGGRQNVILAKRQGFGYYLCSLTEHPYEAVAPSQTPYLVYPSYIWKCRILRPLTLANALTREGVIERRILVGKGSSCRTSVLLFRRNARRANTWNQ